MGEPVCDHEGTPLPYERPFTHGWTQADADVGAPVWKDTVRCRICNYGPDTPRNIAYHLLDTHRLTVAQAKEVLTGGPLPE